MLANRDERRHGLASIAYSWWNYIVLVRESLCRSNARVSAQYWGAYTQGFTNESILAAEL